MRVPYASVHVCVVFHFLNSVPGQERPFVTRQDCHSYSIEATLLALHCISLPASLLEPVLHCPSIEPESVKIRARSMPEQWRCTSVTFPGTPLHDCICMLLPGIRHTHHITHTFIIVHNKRSRSALWIIHSAMDIHALYTTNLVLL
jgi:hypothetical protein